MSSGKGVGLELRLGRTNIMDNRFTKSQVCETPFPKTAKKTNSLYLSLYHFMEQLPVEQRPPRSLVKWTGMFTQEVQTALRDAVPRKKYEFSPTTRPSFTDLVGTKTDGVELPTSWSTNYESEIVRDIFKFIASRSVGYRACFTDSIPVAKTRVESIVRRFFNHLKVRDILAGAVSNTREYGQGSVTVQTNTRDYSDNTQGSVTVQANTVSTVRVVSLYMHAG